MTTTTTRRLSVPGAVLAYDVHEPDQSSGHRPLLVFGSPMAASGFEQLLPLLDDRIVLTYDPRMAERSRLEGDGEVSFEIHADDVHRVVEATGLGPVDVFASSGGAVVVLPWILAHPEDTRTVVAHEPPLTALLEDGDVLARLNADIVATYHRSGQGPAMAKFMQIVMHQGLFTEDMIGQPGPDPTQFGFSLDDDGRRDDPLLAYNMAMTPYAPDGDALKATGVRIVPAVGTTSGEGMPARGARALADLLGVEVIEFPGDHGGFMAHQWSPANDPAAFAALLKGVLDV
jgi:pimeloyl-ACP methyl ester carboxylesterase